MIDVAQLVFSYPGAADAAVRSIDFHVADGEIFGFLGPSGAGKSTTQKILIGLLAPYSGSAQVLGREVRGWGPAFYEEIGISFELPNHYQRLTARENLVHFASLYSGRTRPPREVLEWVGLEHDADKRVAEFSKGMKIRLNVARALVHHPKVLFLDEPTSGLDPVNAKRVKELVLRLRDEGTTVFLTTHDMMVADQLCDRVGFITNGELSVVDSPSALKKRYGTRNVVVEHGAGERTRTEFPLDGLADDVEFQRILREEHIEAMHSQETTLENVFIEVTGESLS